MLADAVVELWLAQHSGLTLYVCVGRSAWHQLNHLPVDDAVTLQERAHREATPPYQPVMEELRAAVYHDVCVYLYELCSHSYAIYCFPLL